MTARLSLLLACGAFLGLATWGEEPPRPAPPARAPGVFRVVCFGDSLTGNRPFEPYQASYVKFSDLLQLMLETRLGDGKAEVINSGWAGDRTYPKPNEGWPGAAKRLQSDVIALQPDVAVMLIGGNDSQKTGAERELTKKNLETMARDLKTAGVRALFLLYFKAMPDPAAPGKAWDQLADQNPVIQAAAQANGFPVLDMDPPMQAAAKRFPRASLANPVDGVHLNPRGEIVFAKAIYAKLVELGWVK